MNNDDALFRQVGLGRLRMLSLDRSAFDGTVFNPPTNVVETDDTVVITIEVAGLEEGSYDIAWSNTDRVLTVTGRRYPPSSEGRVTYHQLEIHQGRFVSQVYLPWPLADAGEATASYTDGFLVVVLPKAKPRQVPVRVITTTEETEKREE